MRGVKQQEVKNDFPFLKVWVKVYTVGILFFMLFMILWPSPAVKSKLFPFIFILGYLIALALNCFKLNKEFVLKNFSRLLLLGILAIALGVAPGIPLSLVFWAIGQRLNSILVLLNFGEPIYADIGIFDYLLLIIHGFVIGGGFALYISDALGNGRPSQKIAGLLTGILGSVLGFMALSLGVERGLGGIDQSPLAYTLTTVALMVSFAETFLLYFIGKEEKK
jgi:hypothetical protein